MYAIMGATGNTGSTVARTLLSEGQKVRAIARNADRLASLKTAGADVVVCEATDSEGLARAFAGASAVYAIVPPNITSGDYRSEQKRTADSIASALEQQGIKYAVTLSSVGADKPTGTGPIAGLHYLEERLNRIQGLNTLHLRAAYFMENTLGHIGAIQALGVVADTLLPDVKIPMIAAHDIGAAAAKALLAPPASPRQTRELLGPRDISMKEITAIIGAAINKSDLMYVQVSDEQARQALVQAGLSPNVVELILEMGSALNSGLVTPLEQRSAINTAPTNFETFVAEVFVPRYRSRSKMA